jgi:DNA mismatch endonuclease (patch repair protein)
MSKSPSFKNFRPSSEKASKLLSARSKKSDTKCERLVRSELWKMGFRFRKNVKNLPGKPDIVFARERVAVFCDGDFWHGNNWGERKKKLKRGANAKYWIAKIQSNIDRDKRYDDELKHLGWKVLRLWELDILRDPLQAAKNIAHSVLSERVQKG